MSDDDLLRRLDERDELSLGNSIWGDAAGRIRELEEQVAFYKAGSFFDAGVHKAGTHVIVPVEPTTLMVHAGVENHERGAVECYRAMIRAAQKKAQRR